MRDGAIIEMPSREALREIIDGLFAALFPTHFGLADFTEEGVDYFVGHKLDATLRILRHQVERELQFASTASEADRSRRAASSPRANWRSPMSGRLLIDREHKPNTHSDGRYLVSFAEEQGPRWAEILKLCRDASRSTSISVSTRSCFRVIREGRSVLCGRVAVSETANSATSLAAGSARRRLSVSFDRQRRRASMSVEFIGMIGTQPASEIHPPRGPAIDVDYVRRFAQAHEESGFDRILIGYFSNGADGFIVAQYAAFVTEKLGLMLAHRPGFVAPTVAARKLATLDHFSGGRLAVHIISGGDDGEQRKDGDFITHDERYERTDEYVEILRRIWTADKPIDHEGEYYKFTRSFSDVKPLQKPHIPIYFGGSSDAAIAIAGKHADVYALWGEPLAEAAKTIARVRASAARHGRTVRFSLSTRPILASTEDAAWARARRIIETISEIRGQAMSGAPAKTPGAVGSQRLLAAAAEGEVLDQRLWTAVAAATGARGNTTALVGTPEQVAESMLAYYDLGVTTFLIRGFDPLEDAIDYGRELIPLVRREIAEREGHKGVAVAGRVAG